MPKAKKDEKINKKNVKSEAVIIGGGSVISTNITQTLEDNYMPYAMSVIVSRALPEIDGFKPSHRKLLYTMYKMGLLGQQRTKSANIVGQTMKLNPHGDGPIYETMVRLAKGYESLLHPYVDSKGNFGKSYSRDMAYAASRYTEAKLDKICEEIFGDIDKDTVDMVPNYDNTTTEPALLPTSFPSILINYSIGIAVSMASNICSFNLEEVCKTAIALIKNPEHKIHDTLKGPDFATGGYILYDKATLKNVINTGRGSFVIRSKWIYDKQNNCIEITQIPPTTTIEAIIDKIVDLIKQGKIKEIADMRDESDLNGLRITIDLKRGIDENKLMQKLYRLTPIQDNFSCNFNILVSGYPRVMGIKEILEEWTAFRVECIKRRISFDLNKMKEKLHLLEGLNKILLDIDKAIKIVRETENDSEVISNLMIGFGIDEIQAEYVSNIRLRNLNKDYILQRTKEISSLQEEIIKLDETLKDKQKILDIICNELSNVIKKHSMPRKTMFIYDHLDNEEDDIEEIPDYPVNIFLSAEGYFKKITPLSLRMGGEQKLKENDYIILNKETTNNTSLLFFTDKMQVYKAKASDFDDTKASALGDFIQAKLGFDEGENLIKLIVTKDYSEHIIFFYENGKVAKIPLISYETKTNRKKLSNAYSNKFKLIDIKFYSGNEEFVLISSDKRQLIFNPMDILEKSTRDSIGVNVLTLKKNKVLVEVKNYKDGMCINKKRYIPKALPSSGFILSAEDSDIQLTLL